MHVDTFELFTALHRRTSCVGADRRFSKLQLKAGCRQGSHLSHISCKCPSLRYQYSKINSTNTCGASAEQYQPG